MLDETSRAHLLAAARDGLEAAVARRPSQVRSFEKQDVLARPGAAFVTLYDAHDGALRGCIGGLEPVRPLAETVRSMAAAAALRDPRFPRVVPEELPHLRISLSVLTPPKPARPEDIQVGRHGIVVQRGHARGVLLPQVAVEQGWDEKTFLEQTCLKAGLTKDAWRDPETRIEAFESENFAEPPIDA